MAGMFTPAQFLAAVKSLIEAGGVPATIPALEKAMGREVLFVSVTVCAPAGVPMAVEVKVRDVGAMVKTGATTLPVKAMD